MKTATVTEFRQKMKEHLNEIRNDQDILILTGPKKMDFVVLTLETFNAMEETARQVGHAFTQTLLVDVEALAGLGTYRFVRVDFDDPCKPITLEIFVYSFVISFCSPHPSLSSPSEII